MRKLLSGVHEVIGGTPMVDLQRLTRAYGVDGSIYAKLEYLNPGYSKKDRIAAQMIKEAEESNLIKPGDTIVELTSGNTGTGLAIVCAVKGYKFVAVMSKGNSTERARMMRALGAEVVLVDQAPESTQGKVSGKDLALVEEAAQRIVKERNAYRTDQFRLAGNVHAHEYYTGEEIWEQTGGNVDVYLDFAGTGGTFMGCAKALKKHSPDVRCYIVEPAAAAYLAEKQETREREAGQEQERNPISGHRIQGGGYSMDLELVDMSYVDGFIKVSDEEAMQFARELAKREGIFAGFSSGANVAAAIKLLQGKESGKRIALTINDSGLKYLSTDLWE